MRMKTLTTYSPNATRRLCLASRLCLAATLGVGVLPLAGCQWAAHSQNAEGVRMFQQAYYPGALQKFQQAVQTDPANPDSYYNLAATYHKMADLHHQKSDLQQAEGYYHQCLDRDPNHQDCYRGLAVLLVSQQRQQDAFKLLEGWAERNPAQSAPKIELARLCEERGDKPAATQHLVEAVAVDPSNSRALAALGKLREEAGDTTQALANYQRSLQVNRFQPQVASRAASLQSSLTPAPIVTPPGGTRTVATPGGTRTVTAPAGTRR